MGSNFVGLPVLCSLASGETFEGTVRKIDATQGEITLDLVKVRRNGLLIRSLPSAVLSRSTVVGLQLLSTSKSEHPTPNSETIPLVSITPTPIDDSSPRGSRKVKVTSAKKNKVKQIVDNVEDNNGRRTHTSGSDNSRGHRARVVESAPSVSNLSEYEEEFDFSAGLRSFDKAKVFQDIRRFDDTDPSLRLHAHNKNHTMAKLSINESVLSADELYDQSQLLPVPSARAHLNHLNHLNTGPETSTDDNSEYEEDIPPPAIRYERRGTLKASNLNNHSNSNNNNNSHHQNNNSTGRSVSSSSVNNRGFITSNGIKTVEVKLKQYKEVLSIADIETGPTIVQRTENAARGIASFLLRTLAQNSNSNNNNNNKRPSIAILVDDCEKGSVALRAGAHLSNHNAKVIAYILTTSDHSSNFKTNLREFSSAGGRILRELEDLADDYDILIDAIADSDTQSQLEPKSQSDLSAASWANESGIPILSIDNIFGYCHDTSAATTPSPLQSTYLVCRGAIRKGVENLSNKGIEILLLDVGISPSLWNRVGVEDFSPLTFGTEFVVPVERL